MGWHSLIRTVNVCFLSVTSEKPTTYWRLSAALLGLIGNLRTVFCLLITGRLKTNNGQLMRGRKPLAVHCATRLSNKTKIYAWLMLWTCVLLLFGFVRKFEFFLFFFENAKQTSRSNGGWQKCQNHRLIHAWDFHWKFFSHSQREIHKNPMITIL